MSLRYPGIEQAKALLAALETSSLDMDDDPYALMEALDDHGFVIPGFNWLEWDEGRQRGTDVRWISSLDLQTLAKLFTAHARNDRFCENHWFVLGRQGVLKAMLKRLEELAV